MTGWLPKVAIAPTGTPGLMEDDHSFFYGKALIIQWGEFVVELTFARSDEERETKPAPVGRIAVFAVAALLALGVIAELVGMPT